MESQGTFNRVIPRDYYGRILTGDYSVELKRHVAGYVDAYHAFERTGNPAIVYLSAWHEDNEGKIWYEFVSERFARIMGCSRDQVADVFRDRILDQHILRYNPADAGIQEEVRDREALDGAARELREDVKRRGVGDAVYKVSLDGGRIGWFKDMARIEAYAADGICLSCGSLTPVTKERRAEAERLERERLQVSLQMAGAVCHEMNQPMQSISGYSESLVMNMTENDAVRVKLQKIIDLTRQMGQFTRKLSRITRYETKDYVAGLKIVDIDRASGDVPEVE